MTDDSSLSERSTDTDTPDDPVEQFIRAERQPERDPEVSVTGLMMQYLHVCERELWFASRGLDIDRGAPNIRRGTRIDETSYRDKRESFQINGRIAIDVLDDGRVMEVKASSKLEEPARMQLLYYLWYLDEICDVQRDGVLAYPAERKRESVELTPETRTAVESALQRIFEVVRADTPPPLEKKPVCESCLYQDICWM
jgi:CRISPR-associated exonuclease Cas4